MFSYNGVLTGDKLDVYMEGSLDALSSPEFMEYMKTHVDGVNILTLHMDKVDYISSAGLRIIIVCMNNMDGDGKRMEIAGANETIRDTFNITGLIGQLNLV